MCSEGEPEAYIACSPLSVVLNLAGKLRLVFNLRYLNQFMHTVKFKYENLRTAALLFEKGGYLPTCKSGYHHLDIHPDQTHFLGFQWGNSVYVQLSLCVYSVDEAFD